ncbi:MAG: 3-dehydroquinate synthase [Verrucomicrobiae bacterium]|nr:3-dehydroquinate synthase [Verrucomicrobiae bacterium]
MLIGHKALHHLPHLLHQLSPLPTALAILTDSNLTPTLHTHLLPILQPLPYPIHTLTIPAGEASKSLHTLPPLLSSLASARLDRHAILLALGGGVVGDLAGFLAGIYLRGIRYIQIPTSLLAMVDSSVGGKTGVNLPEGKNLVGVFHQPTAVIADLDLLSTLPTRELHAGFAEIIKYGAIADPHLLDLIQHGPPPDLLPIITRSIQIKADIVTQDERETTGTRALLNFGHTAGHAIEAITAYTRYLHGEAIALGMRVATRLSRLVLDLPENQETYLLRIIAAHNLPLHDPSLDLDALLARLPNDKKAQAGHIRWILLPRLGQAQLVESVPLPLVQQALSTLHHPPSL